MTKKIEKINQQKDLIKFLAPLSLQKSLQSIANERNISLSALLRIITSEYVKRFKLE